MPKSVLTRKRSAIARIAILAMIFSLMAVALPASAHSVAIDTTGPCPAATPSAGFTDIGALDATTQNAINCLFAFGITTGTSATTYSPNDTVPRWQMALFLVRQAADHGLTIPAATSQGYTDIGGFDAATQNAINQITQLGISKGTSSTTFSPNLSVSRWQMALFLYRLALAAGVSFTNDSGHNEFTDIGGTLAEAQTAINALADAHIALGTGGSAFSPDLLLNRWQMALFLTRILAADGVAAPAGLRVTVTPTDTVTQSAGTGRAYTATFKNANGTPYTGPVGVMLRIVSSAGVIDWDGESTVGTTCPDNTTFEAPTDGLIAGPGGPFCGPSLRGFPGADGIVSFTVRHAGAAERVVPVAWEDLDGDGLAEISGNAAPTEPFGVGGQTAFTATAAAEAADGAFAALTVHLVDKAGDRFEAGDCLPAAGVQDCSYFYDSSDLFRIEGVATDLAGFEAALNVNDVVTGVYDDTVASQSTFDISTDTDADLTITSPAAATTVDAFSFAVTGTAVPGYTVAIYVDSVNDGVKTAGESKVGETTAAADGTWTINVPLTQNSVNDFVATQRSNPVLSDTGTGLQVPLITEGAAAAAQITAAAATNGGAAGSLDVGDTITVTFNEDVAAAGAGDTIDLLEQTGGTSVRLTVGTNATTTINAAGDAITFTVTAAPTVLGAGDNGVLLRPL